MNDVVDATMLDLDRFAIGQPVPRSEDPVLVSGKGRFADDVNLTGQAYAVIVRSTYAHGVIRSIDTAAPAACGVCSPSIPRRTSMQAGSARCRRARS